LAARTALENSRGMDLKTRKLLAHYRARTRVVSLSSLARGVARRQVAGVFQPRLILFRGA
jgi:hypothetical protein